MLNIISLILGIALLIAGRKLFWLFVGAAGFLAGMQLAPQFWRGPEITVLLIGLLIGVVFAVLAIFLEGVAIGVAGFLAGGYVLTALVSMIGLNPGGFSWIVYVIGGIIGVLFVIFLFDWALITLSSLAGASLVTQALPTSGGPSGVLYLALVIIGVVIQGMIMQRERIAPVD